VWFLRRLIFREAVRTVDHDATGRVARGLGAALVALIALGCLFALATSPSPTSPVPGSTPTNVPSAGPSRAAGGER